MSRKRCIWRCSWWFTWWCNQGCTFESLYASFIFYIEQNKQNCWHFKLDSEADVHRCLQPFTEKDLFISFLLKSQTDSLKKESTRDVFQYSCLIFQHFFLRNTFGWWLLLLNTIHFLCCVDLISKMFLLTLALLWLSLNIFKVNTVSHLWTAVPGSPRQLVDFFADKTSNTFKMFLEIRNSLPAVFF